MPAPNNEGAASRSVQGEPSAARTLVFGGILLILAGLLLGEIFAIFISHEASAEIQREWVAAVTGASHRDRHAITAAFDRIRDLLELRGRIMDTHSHMIAYGFIALTLALLQPIISYSERWRQCLAICVVAGGLVQCGFVFVSYYVRGWPFLVSDVGGGLILLGITGNIAGLSGAPREFNFTLHIAQTLASVSSRILLRVGALLILVGMLFGFYYAWLFVTQHEPGQMRLLDQAFAGALDGNTHVAITSIVEYRTLQSRIAIVTAAHSHIIEMGIMAILLALVQDYVFLSAHWKRRWAMVFCIGATLMPVSTYTASVFGLVPAGFADAFGLMSMVALFAMLTGLVRYTRVAHREGAAL